MNRSRASGPSAPRHFGRVLLAGLIPMLVVAMALGDDGDKMPQPRTTRDRPSPRIEDSPLDVDHEAVAMAFVREHHPELASVLEPLQWKNPAEYRKAITELSQVARNLALVKSRNGNRYELALEAWKTRSRVELVAAQLAGSPSEELRGKLRQAIEAKVDAEIRRQKYDLEQAEEAARKLRLSLDRLENHRVEVVEARFRALQPKKARGSKGQDGPKPVTVPSSAVTKENRP